MGQAAWAVLRHGGKLTKYKGQVASIAPFCAAVIVTTAVSGTALMAGSCTALSGGASTCSGGLSATDTPQFVSSSDAVTVTVTTDPGFAIATSYGNAISLSASGSTTGLSLIDDASNTTGIITGGETGIAAKNAGTGATIIETTAPVYGAYGDGISVSSGPATTALSVTTNGNVTGLYSGIYASHFGTGAATITTNKAVTGYSSYGITAVNGGLGALTITANGAVSGYTDGIEAINETEATDLNITVGAVGSATGYYGAGIYAAQNGSGDTTITVTGGVAGAQGIVAYNSASSGSLTINTVNVTGAYNAGIAAGTIGSDLSITSTGSIGVNTSGYAGASIGVLALNGIPDPEDAQVQQTSDIGFAPAPVASGDITINVNNISGGTTGIAAGQLLGGSLSITATGAISTQAPEGTYFLPEGGFNLALTPEIFGTGIFAYNGGGSGTGTTINANSIDAFGEGIYAYNASGALSITTTGQVTGGASSYPPTIFGSPRDGIEATNLGTDLTLNVSNVTGSDDGIDAVNYGSGALTITATGTVLGGTFTPYGLTQQSGDGPAREEPVAVFSGGNGIEATNSQYGTDLTINANNVYASDEAIDAVNYGTGNLTITVTGNVEGGIFMGGYPVGNETEAAGSASAIGYYPQMRPSLDGQGIQATNYGVDLSITAVNVIGSSEGIYASNFGTGATTIVTTGDVNGGSTVLSKRLISGDDAANEQLPALGVYAIGGSGIDVATGSETTDLTINVNNVSGGKHGIIADHEGTGALEITATGSVTAGPAGGFAVQPCFNCVPDVYTNEPAQAYSYLPNTPAGVGIFAGSTQGTDLSITAVDVTGFGDGIFALNSGTGATTITTTGDITGGLGIHSFTYAVGAASNGGAAAEPVFDVVEEPSGPNLPFFTYGNGITAVQEGGTSLTIDTGAGTVTGALHGIYAYNDGGSGGVSITSTGTIQAIGSQYAYFSAPQGEGSFSGNGTGVYSLNTTGGNTVLSVNNVSGTLHGIIAEDWTGDLSITATGSVYGGQGLGIYGYAGGDLAITAKDVASDSGLAISSFSITGNNTVMTSGDVSGAFGIVAGAASGNVDVTTTGAVTATNGNGIAGISGAGDVTISSSDTVQGTVFGILGASTESGTVSITVTGDVLHIGSSVPDAPSANEPIEVVPAAILAATQGNATVDIASSVSIEDATGVAVDMTAVDGIATLALRNGFSLTGGAFSTTDDTDDILALTGSENASFYLANVGNTSAAGGVVGFENLSVDGGANWTITGTQSAGDFSSGQVAAGSTLSFSDAVLSLVSGGTLSILGNMAVSGKSGVAGNLSLPGSLSMSDGAADDALAVQGDFAGGGTLVFDVDFATNAADTLAVAGNISGSSLVDVNGVNTDVADGEAVTLITFGGTSSSSDFALSSGPLTLGLFTYDLELDTEASAWNLVSSGLDAGATVGYQGLTTAILGGSGSLNQFGPNTGNQGGRTRNAAPRPGVEVSPEDRPWARVFGFRSDGTDSDGGTNTYSFKNRVTGVQGGIPLWTLPTDNGTWTIGSFVEYKSIKADLSNSTGLADVEADSFGLGVDAFWTSSQGHYVGVVAQAAWLDSDVTSAAGGTLVEGHSSNAYSFMLTGGYRFDLDERRALTPFASLLFSSLDGGSFTDTGGNTVDLGENDTLIATIGAEYSIASASGAEHTFSGALSRELSSLNEVSVGTLPLQSSQEVTVLEIGVGSSVPLGNGSEIFFDASYGKSIGGSFDRDSASLGIGFRASW